MTSKETAAWHMISNMYKQMANYRIWKLTLNLPLRNCTPLSKSPSAKWTPYSSPFISWNFKLKSYPQDPTYKGNWEMHSFLKLSSLSSTRKHSRRRRVWILNRQIYYIDQSCQTFIFKFTCWLLLKIILYTKQCPKFFKSILLKLSVLKSQTVLFPNYYSFFSNPL